MSLWRDVGTATRKLSLCNSAGNFSKLLLTWVIGENLTMFIRIFGWRKIPIQLLQSLNFEVIQTKEYDLWYFFPFVFVDEILSHLIEPICCNDIGGYVSGADTGFKLLFFIAMSSLCWLFWAMIVVLSPTLLVSYLQLVFFWSYMIYW